MQPVPADDVLATSAEGASPVGAPTETHQRWRRTARSDAVLVLAIYAVSRLPILLGALVATTVTPARPRLNLLRPYDAAWYLWIAQHGYSPTLHPHDFHHGSGSDWAFFPAFPLAVRAVHDVTRLGYTASGYVMGVLFGYLAVLAVYRLGTLVGGRGVAVSSAMLFAVWPGGAVLSMPYTEGLFVASAGFALVAMHRRRWVLAGLAGLVATASRPTGVAVLVAAVVCAGIAIARERQWRSLVVPVLSAMGVGGYFGYAEARAHDWLIWLRAEALWHQRLDFERSFPSEVVRPLLHHSAANAARAGFLVLGFAALAAMIVGFIRYRSRFSATMLAFAATTIATLVLYSHVGPRPRMLDAVVPGFVALGLLLTPRGRNLTVAVFAAFAALFSLTVFGLVAGP